MTQEEFQKRYQYNPNTDCIGEGGFGKVFKAYDTHLNHYVAIKVADVKPNFESVRLRNEVERVNKLPSHPNIAHYEKCYTFSTFAGEYDFGVLQYYDQGNLHQLITEKQLTYYQKDSMLKQILEGIGFLHNQGIIHRDLKPQNILIALNQNNVYVPKITDFGISKTLDTNKSSVYNHSLIGWGTESFASPEQLKGHTIRKNTDLWSFGVIICWMFTGKLPFNSGSLAATSAEGRMELYRQIAAGEVTTIIAQLPSDWRNLVRQCLVVDVEKRISSADKCLEILSGKVKIEEIKVTTTTNATQNQQNGNQKTNSNKTVILKENTVIDIDGNVYNTIRIGSQEWMLENLRTTRYSNGEKIETTDSKTKSLFFNNKPKYQWSYDEKADIGGRLYTWYAATDPKGIAPSGWRVATWNDWERAKKYIDEKGLKVFEVLNLIKAGKRRPNGSFINKNIAGHWWNSDSHSADNNWGKDIYYDSNQFSVGGQSEKKEGLSIRCVRNVY